MGEIKSVKPEKLVIAFIYSNENVYENVKKELAREYGEIDYESRELDFTWTGYYNAEMGEGLKRRFVSFKNNVDPGLLAGIKLRTNEIENRYHYAGTGKRMINIDPGLLSEAKFVLATTKNFQHRIYIGKGIFAEATLRYKDKRFTGWEWTYPDYLTGEYISILSEIRKIYRQSL